MILLRELGKGLPRRRWGGYPFAAAAVASNQLDARGVNPVEWLVVKESFLFRFIGPWRRRHLAFVLAFVLLPGVKVANAASGESLSEAVAATFREQAKLAPIDGATGDNFGFSVSLSGNRALIGAYSTDENGANSGSAFIFGFDGTTWSQEAKLLPSDGAAGDFFGGHVSLSGNRALVGASYKGDSFGDNGAAYVFVFDGTNWKQEAKLINSDNGFLDRFGESVSLSGTRALISAPFHGTGVAYYFVLNGGTWVEQAQLTADGGAAAINAVSLSGKRALLGAREIAPENASYIFVYDGSSWTQEAKITSGVPSDGFGLTVSLSGTHALISASLDDAGAPNSGAAYIFGFDGATWNQEARLTPADPKRNAMFGASVSLSGSRALIGAAGARNANDSSTGAAYLFASDGTSWVQQDKLTASDGEAFADFGSSVSLLGSRALIGAPGDFVQGVQSGSAYIFGR